MSKPFSGVVWFAAAACFPVAAHASIVVSSDPTQNVSCVEGRCAPTADTATLNVSDLESLLAAGSVLVTTTGYGVEANNIIVSSSLSWFTPNALTLVAHRSVTIKKRVGILGQGGLMLSYDDNNGKFDFGHGGAVEFSSTSSLLQVNGDKYTLVNSIRKLAKDIEANPIGKYALAKSYNAARDGTYASSPIITAFDGTFEGLGNTISGLTIYDTAQGGVIDVGLFEQNGAGGVIRDIRLVSASVTGTDTAIESEEYMGSLVGDNAGLVVGAFANSSVSGDTDSEAGGLVGANDNGGKIISSSVQSMVAGGISSGGLLGTAFRPSLVQDCEAASTVFNGGGLVGDNGGKISDSSSSGTVQNGGGLVESNDGYAVIENSHSSAEVDASEDAAYVGGLAAINGGTIKASYATGMVNGEANADTGGLVAYDSGTIIDSYSTGATHGKGGSNVGGLVGEASSVNGGLITTSHATGPVTGGGSVGGLVGFNDNTVLQSFSTGSVTGTGASYVGGLGGENRGIIKDSYATGAVTGPSGGSAGGLIGHDMDIQGATDAVSASYSTGFVTGSTADALGGSVGIDQSHTGTFVHIYWDTDTSGVTNLSQGAGNIADDPGLTGQTTAQLVTKLPKGLKNSIWGEDPDINGGLPYLLANPPVNK